MGAESRDSNFGSLRLIGVILTFALLALQGSSALAGTVVEPKKLEIVPVYVFATSKLAGKPRKRVVAADMTQAKAAALVDRLNFQYEGALTFMLEGFEVDTTHPAYFDISDSSRRSPTQWDRSTRYYQRRALARAKKAVLTVVIYNTIDGGDSSGLSYLDVYLRRKLGSFKEGNPVATVDSDTIARLGISKSAGTTLSHEVGHVVGLDHSVEFDDVFLDNLSSYPAIYRLNPSTEECSSGSFCFSQRVNYFDCGYSAGTGYDLFTGFTQDSAGNTEFALSATPARARANIMAGASTEEETTFFNTGYSSAFRTVMSCWKSRSTQ